jgi:hypothetical protein
LAYITSKYTDIRISYTLSQHIENIDIIIINTKTHVQNILIQKICILIYIYWPLRLSECLHTKNILAHWLVPHLGTQNRLTSLSKRYKNAPYNQGASRAPPASPPSGGGGGPPPPTPGGGGGTSAGPPCPDGRRPLVIAASTAARRMIDRHGGGNLMHCSRNSLSWIRVHMPSGMSRKTVSSRRTRSSSSLAAAGGA